MDKIIEFLRQPVPMLWFLGVVFISVLAFYVYTNELDDLKKELAEIREKIEKGIKN